MTSRFTGRRARRGSEQPHVIACDRRDPAAIEHNIARLDLAVIPVAILIRGEHGDKPRKRFSSRNLRCYLGSWSHVLL